VSFLCQGRLGSILGCSIRQIVFPVPLADELTSLSLRLWCHVGRVRPHVGDQPHGRTIDIDALVELLSKPHGLPWRQVQAIAGGGLQRAGDKGRLWPPTALTLFHIAHLVFGLLEHIQQLIHVRALFEIGVLASDFHQTRTKLLLLRRPSL